MNNVNLFAIAALAPSVALVGVVVGEIVFATAREVAARISQPVRRTAFRARVAIRRWFDALATPPSPVADVPRLSQL